MSSPSCCRPRGRMSRRCCARRPSRLHPNGSPRPRPPLPSSSARSRRTSRRRRVRSNPFAGSRRADARRARTRSASVRIVNLPSAAEASPAATLLVHRAGTAPADPRHPERRRGSEPASLARVSHALASRAAVWHAPAAVPAAQRSAASRATAPRPRPAARAAKDVAPRADSCRRVAKCPSPTEGRALSAPLDDVPFARGR